MTTDIHSKTIAIIGGGFTGSTIAIQQAQHYIALQQQGHNLGPLTLKLIDQNNSFGPGLPYETQDDVFLLNQPADAMSPFPDDAAHFTRWLGADGASFATRRAYGDYLKQTLRETFKAAAEAGVTIQLECVHDKITGLDLQHGQSVIEAEVTGLVAADAVIIATGHEKNDFLHNCRTHENFFSSTYKVDDVKSALIDCNIQDNIVIIGTGQSMMDALATIDQTGFKGKIYAVSRHGAEPWAYHPEHYVANDDDPYQPAFLNVQNLSQGGDWSFGYLQQQLDQEFAHAAQTGYDVGHVLTAIDFDALKSAAPNDNDLNKLRHLWAKVYGNPSPPERHALFQNYKAEGRLEIVCAEVNEQTVEPVTKGYVAHLGGALENLKAVAIFNAVAYDRRSLASPLLRQAADQDALNLDPEGNILGGQQKNPRVFAAGPIVNPDKWGVETFRDNNARVAKQSIETVYKL